MGLENKRYGQYLLHQGCKLLAERFWHFPVQSLERLPNFLAASDLIVISQHDSYATKGQVPAKLFDAMAMAKPIIATNVPDIPYILGKAGWIIKPKDPLQLAETIRYVMEHPQEGRQKGKLSREQCVNEFGWELMENRLRRVVSKTLNKFKA